MKLEKSGKSLSSEERDKVMEVSMYLYMCSVAMVTANIYCSRISASNLYIKY